MVRDHSENTRGEIDRPGSGRAQAPTTGPASGPAAWGRSALSERATQPTAEQYRTAAALRAGLRRFSQASGEILRRHGLTSERYELLLAIKSLHAAGSQATITELTSELGVAQASLTQLVRRVEDAGLLIREVSPRDARVRHLKLTRQGERQLAAAISDLTEERSRLASVLGQP